MRLPPRRSQARCSLPGMRRGGEGVKRLPRLRKVCKWTGLVLSVLLLVVWVGSGWYGLHVRTQHWNIDLMRGVLVFAEADPMFGPHVFVRHPLRIERLSPHAQFAWWFYWNPDYFCTAPLWCPLVGAAVPTAVLWRRDRRFSKPVLCKQCSYDIRGVAVCPECGARPL